jgi:hypothetical protein
VAEKPARVIAYQKVAPLKARKRVHPSVTIQFLAEMSNGLIYQFISKPPKLDLVEIVKTPDGAAKVVGFGTPPSQNHTILNPATESFLARMFKWEETVGDLRRYWETTLDLEKPSLYFVGPGGGLFHQAFQIQRLPRAETRPYLHEHMPDSTYVNGIWIDGTKAPGTKVSSTEKAAKDEDDGFEWSFLATRRGEMNRAHLLVADGDQQFKAYYEMYKGYPRELSFRGSGIVGTGGNVLVNAEATFNYWLEDLLGWSSYYLSRQRWGWSLKVFRSLTPMTLDVVSNTVTNITFDLKYRLTRGLWNRDETWGVIVGYNNLSYDVFQVQELGGGFFWARSMPRLFDDLFNRIPFMRYPKWVDMELIYYPVLIPNRYTTILSGAGYGNWALNFHGKIMWGKDWYGEGGFGMKSIGLVEETPDHPDHKRLKASFLEVYGTAGLGIQF